MSSGSGGSIRKRANGTWEGRYRQAGHERSVYAKTRGEAKVKLRDALTRVEHKVTPADGRTSVAAYLDEWLESCERRGKIKPRTLDSYRSVVRLYLKPHIGRIAVAKLTKQDVDALLDKVRVGRSPTTTRYARTVLRISLQAALEANPPRIHRNAASEADVPGGEGKTFTPLTVDQARTFLQSVKGARLEVLYMTALQLGLRQGELLGLRWQDVDLDGRVISVKNSLQRVNGQLDLVSPKTKNSKRLLDTGADLTRALREHRIRQLEERLAAGRRWQEGDFVFTTTIGTPLDGINVTHRFQAALLSAGLPHQRFHDLRHACATMQLEDGEELAVVSKMLGHSSYATTVNFYSHWTRDMRRRPAKRMDKLFAGTRAASS